MGGFSGPAICHCAPVSLVKCIFVTVLSGSIRNDNPLQRGLRRSSFILLYINGTDRALTLVTIFWLSKVCNIAALGSGDGAEAEKNSLWPVDAMI